MSKSDQGRAGSSDDGPIVEQPFARPNPALKLPSPTGVPTQKHHLSDMTPYLAPEDVALIMRLKSRLYGREDEV